MQPPSAGIPLFDHELAREGNRKIGSSSVKQPAHRALNPFGSIPTFEDGNLALFESGRSFCTSPSGMLDCFLVT
ncbi:MAG TPA: hypothetical protein VFG30_01280, partial [Polyangiales bacterium]|nr:hypothetical protein [Polyangiales bacterium]